jgi:hypothetical protein
MTETIQETKPEQKVETIVIGKPVKQKRKFSGFDIDVSVELPELTIRVPAKAWAERRLSLSTPRAASLLPRPTLGTRLEATANMRRSARRQFRRS